MSDTFIQLLAQSQGIPLLTAVLLGLFAAINPCQIAINLSAMTYIIRRTNDAQTNGEGWARRVICYLAGRFTLFFLLGWASILLCRLHSYLFESIADHFRSVELVVPFLLLAFGLFFFYRALHRHKHDGACHDSAHLLHKSYKFGPFLLGMLLALLFCPESAVIFFGMMVPLGVSDTTSYLVPLAFSLSALLPFVLLLIILRRASNQIAHYETLTTRLQQSINLLLGTMFVLLAIAIWMFD